MVTPPAGNITLLLRELKCGDRTKFDQLLELVYPDLRRLAARHFRSERPGHLLQPTALVNEAYMRLVAHNDRTWENRSHFFGVAAQLMRRILIEHARAAQAKKRGGRDGTMALDNLDLPATSRPMDFLALDGALTALATVSARQARVVELRYFGGMSVPEVAEAIGVDQRTVDRDWAAARAWLRQRLGP